MQNNQESPGLSLEKTGSTAKKISVIQATTAEDGARWTEFVGSNKECTIYHRWEWKSVTEGAHKWPTFFLMAVCNDWVCGILPLVWIKSRLFGNLLCSMPFLSGGGIVAADRETAKELLRAAAELANSLDVDYVELRDRSEGEFDLPTTTSKIRVILQLLPDSAQMFSRLDKKVRSDVRKSEKSGFIFDYGHRELLDDFYNVFSANMRDLGTPVYGVEFFRAMLAAFPNESYICRIRLDGKTVAASFLLGYRETVEVMWSSSLRNYLSLKPNMFLYWNLFRFSAQKGYRSFDFGRSTPGGGTHRFKLQWGGVDHQLYWHYLLRHHHSPPALNPHNPKYRLPIWMWKKLPVLLTRYLGPPIARCLP